MCVASQAIRAMPVLQADSRLDVSATCGDFIQSVDLQRQRGAAVVLNLQLPHLKVRRICIYHGAGKPSRVSLPTRVLLPNKVTYFSKKEEHVSQGIFVLFFAEQDIMCSMRVYVDAARSTDACHTDPSTVSFLLFSTT